jgi:predicted dehydrogenase/threonine dehydrogenase-like Zn-dependent dehydrogenase
MRVRGLVSNLLSPHTPTMQQVAQNLETGEILLENVAVPEVAAGHLLIQTSCSLISSGTERSIVDSGRASLLAKVRQHPEKIKKALDRVRTDGLAATIQAVKAQTEGLVPLGYCNVGRVLAVGRGVSAFAPGDRVVSNGHHAEVVMVPQHLAARIPDGVSDEAASFAVVAAIGLQGIRLIGPTLGERVAVFGLGLIGLLAVQILRAHGANVIGFDYDSGRVALAGRYGVQSEDLSLGVDPVAAAMAFTQEIGVDGVLVTAATQSDELMHQAAQMSRHRGRIVLTGVAGLNLQRADFYEKELSFQVSCSYGPGRYDPSYEQQGHDYPLAFVRWTEQRNFEAVLDLMRQKRLSSDELISLRAPLAEIRTAYDAVAAKKAVGVVLTYPQPATPTDSQSLTNRTVRLCAAEPRPGAAVCAMVGAGSFAQQKILPALVKAGARIKWVVTSQGFSGTVAARKFGIEQSTTDYNATLEDPEVDTVVIATRHDSHARLLIQALAAGKSVFVEKPLCLAASELDEIAEAYRRAAEAFPLRPILMVGYNRRFAPLVTRLRAQIIGRKQPLAMTLTCNAGSIPASHWSQDPNSGGGRILGEACHFIDLLHFLAGEAPITQVAALGHGPLGSSNLNDTVAIVLRLADGSLGQINYFANGARQYPKERLEVFSEGSVLRIDNFRRLEGFGVGRRCRKRTWTQDKGHDEEFRLFIDAIRNGTESPIPFESLLNTSRATLATIEALANHKVVDVG